MSDCIFCRIASGAIPSEKILDNEHFFVIQDIHPKAPVHLLLIPYEHIPNLLDLEAKHAALLGKMLVASSQLAQKYDLSGFRTIINSGQSAGQEVFHLHFHLLANTGSAQKKLPWF